MGKSTFVFISCMAVLSAWSCSNQNREGIDTAENRVLQHDDGTISLELEKAACYTDALNPSSNTAEWSVVISKPGRYKVWLTSATKDPFNLKYANSVRISLLDYRLEVHPSGDKIMENSADVPYSYFKVDSYMGSFLVSKPGEYDIQVISEKVIASNAVEQNMSQADDTMLLSLLLTPMTQ